MFLVPLDGRKPGGWTRGAVRVARVHTSSLGPSQVGREAARLPYSGPSGLHLCEIADGSEAEETDVPCTDPVNPLLSLFSLSLFQECLDPKGDRNLLGDTVHSAHTALWLPSLLPSLPCSIHLPKFVDILCVDDHFF